MSDPEIRETLLNAALFNVAFDGWAQATFDAAVSESGVDPVVAKGLFPRGALDLAVAFHKRGDAQMVAALGDMDLNDMRFRDRIAAAVRARLETIEDKEAVRRGVTLFALPLHAPEGLRLMWGTADAIWTELGDTSEDVNWYSKRATLSGVYSATVLFWLGDDSPDHDATWEFLDRRIDDVMQIEKLKANVQGNKLLSQVLAGPLAILGRVKAPNARPKGFPGHWTGQE